MAHQAPDEGFLEAAEPRQGRSRSPNNWQDGLSCARPFRLYCLSHAERRLVPCRRWRHCEGCARRLQGELVARFVRSIEEAPDELPDKFFTVTFPNSRAPDETEAHRALRSLTRRLRHRELLDQYGWVLQRQRNGTLHYHGLMTGMPFMDDGLALWRELVVASGFGPIQNLQQAKREHASYCARYISTRLAKLAPLHRAYGFSQGFPQAPIVEARRAREEAGALIGMASTCEWVPAHVT
jgi:hypothetical protein